MNESDKQNTKESHLEDDSQLDLEQQKLERFRQRLRILEAALYVAGRPLDINELCSALGTRSKRKCQRLIDALIKDYASRITSLEILQLKDQRYVLQLKADFTPLVKKLVNRPLLSSGPLKTLSYIAYRQPVSQKRVIEVRGQHAYGHVKTLKDMGYKNVINAGAYEELRKKEEKQKDLSIDFEKLTHPQIFALPNTPQSI